MSVQDTLDHAERLLSSPTNGGEALIRLNSWMKKHFGNGPLPMTVSMDDHRRLFSLFEQLQNNDTLALGVVLALLPVSALAPLSRTSKELRTMAFPMLCNKWVVGLMATRIFGTDPVGIFASGARGNHAGR